MSKISTTMAIVTSAFLACGLVGCTDNTPLATTSGTTNNTSSTSSQSAVSITPASSVSSSQTADSQSYTGAPTCPASFDARTAVINLFNIDPSSVKIGDFAPGKSVDDNGNPEPDDYSCNVNAFNASGVPVLFGGISHDRTQTWEKADIEWSKFVVQNSLDNKGTIPLGPVTGVFTQSPFLAYYIVFPAPPGDTGVYILKFYDGDSQPMFELAKAFAEAVYSTSNSGQSSAAAPTTGCPDPEALMNDLGPRKVDGITGFSIIQCSGMYTIAVGSTANNADPILFQLQDGTWVPIDKDAACANGEVPAEIHGPACEAG